MIFIAVAVETSARTAKNAGPVYAPVQRDKSPVAINASTPTHTLFTVELVTMFAPPVKPVRQEHAYVHVHKTHLTLAMVDALTQKEAANIVENVDNLAEMTSAVKMEHVPALPIAFHAMGDVSISIRTPNTVGLVESDVATSLFVRMVSVWLLVQIKALTFAMVAASI